MICECWRVGRFLMTTLLWLSASTSVMANLASPFPVDAKQPDGTSIVLYIRGTEHLNWYEYVPEVRGVHRAVLDTPQGLSIGGNAGYTVIQDQNGQYVFASRDANGDWAATAAVVGKDQPPQGTPRRLMPDQARIRTMIQARMPEMHDAPQQVTPIGDVRNLVILMRFKDHKQRTLPSAADFDVIFNTAGGDPGLASTGSVFDVYNENSYGKLRLQSKIVGWVDLPKTEKQYAAGESGLTTAVQQAIVDALNAVVAGNLVNFADFDNENGGSGDKRIDAITFVHSGYAAEWGGVDSDGADYKDRIWSHRWAIPEWSGNPAGVRVSDYNINPGLWSTSGKQPGRIGVICHELGHFFGLPDLYDYSQKGEGAGSWCLMANSWGFNGSQLHPPHFSAWSKVFLGWNQPIVLSSPGTYDVTATAVPGAEIYRVNFPGVSASEYLLVENRQPIGNFDGGIVAGSDGVRGGLAIWHIDDNKEENDDPGFPGQPGWPANGHHYRVALLQADGAYGLEQGMNRGDGDDVFRAGLNDQITSITLPSSSSYSGVAVPEITAISASSRKMTFQFGDQAGGGGEEDGGTGKHTGCCPVTANAIVAYGSTTTANSKIATVTVTLAEDSMVHLTANGSVLSDQGVAMSISTGFFNKDVPADPNQDEMWFPSLRFATLAPNSWTNFGSTTAIPLPKGTHTIHWKVWVSSATLTFDSGTLLVEAFPLKAAMAGPSPFRAFLSQGNSVRASDRQATAAKAADGGGPPKLCCSEAFEALLALIAKADDKPELRIDAIKTAANLVTFDREGCEKLDKVLSVVITSVEDDADVRKMAIEVLTRLL